MWAVSDRFLAAVQGSHAMSTRVSVLDQGEPVEGFEDLPVVAGEVTRDSTAVNYGRLSGFQIASEAMAPRVPSSPLGPAGFELFVERGIHFPDGTTEMVPLGVFGIQDSDVDWIDLTTGIDAVDRSQRVSDAKFEVDYTPTEGVDQSLNVAAIVADVFPDIAYDLEDPSELVPAGLVYEAEEDRWDIVQDICTSTGFEAFFDGLGRLVFRRELDARSVDPMLVVSDTTVIVSGSTRWSRRPSHNKAIVTGTNTEFDVTYRGVAVDNSPTSPSYYSGRFGPKPFFHFSPHVVSNASAVNAAKAILRAKQGVAMSLDFSLVPNPALEPGDVVVVRRSALGIDMPVVVDAISIGLAPEDAMTCEVRARQDDEITEG